MKYRRLGKTNLRVSVVGIGTWQLGGEWGKDFTQDEVDRMFDRCRDLGVNLIDTAECYGEHLAERLIGNAIERDRDHWVVATKFGHKFHGYMNRTDERSARHVREQLDASLAALKTDYVDVYQYHSVRNSEFDDPEVRQVLREANRAGKVRHVGSSISPNDNIYPVDHAAEADVEVVQVIYNRLDRKPEERVFPSCMRQDLGVLARVPLASGFLTGKYKPGARFGERDYRHEKKQEEIDRVLREVEKIRGEEVPAGVPMATWALAWCLQHPAVGAVIPGCKSVEQVESNAAAAELDMVRDDHPQAWKEVKGSRSP
jgi:aryl-alcohol dehydrogenase-like predicted oxidoreductase